ncbi:unnamed protein product [Gongylonema pulchrum]|uniref:Wax2_C domain-containing protein n=1 Tax=Gongylonema pulchrum TaxID=637853 RepID=A0A183DJX8_9BILA|nr:unnamed protein product [Gongylonema pulchrum]
MTWPECDQARKPLNLGSAWLSFVGVINVDVPEVQVKSISDHIRPDRQCLMFSATFKSKVERLAREALTDPVRIVQGEIGEVLPFLMHSILNLCLFAEIARINGLEFLIVPPPMPPYYYSYRVIDVLIVIRKVAASCNVLSISQLFFFSAYITF